MICKICNIILQTIFRTIYLIQHIKQYAECSIKYAKHARFKDIKENCNMYKLGSAARMAVLSSVRWVKFIINL